MKKTVSVSIDEGILAKAKERAWKERKSMSQFIEDMVSLTLEKHQVVYPFEPQETQKPVAEYPETVEDKVVGTVSNFIKERDDQFHVKTPRGPVKANNAMNSFFKPQPKLKDKAKK